MDNGAHRKYKNTADTGTSMTIEARLTELGIILPEAAAPLPVTCRSWWKTTLSMSPASFRLRMAS